MPNIVRTCYPQICIAFVLIVLNTIAVKPANAHGSIISPESRIYKCRFGDNPENPSNPACRAAKSLVGSSQFFYDWNAVRQPNANGNHKSLIRDGELCSGGNPDFRGLDLTRSDWRATPIAADRNGQFEFVYHATAAHSTRDMIFHITKPNWKLGSGLKWADMEEFCRLGSVPLVIDPAGRNVYKMKCDLPERSGMHVVYHIWQRDDSGEAFYSCSDVLFETKPIRNCSASAGCTLPAVNLILDN